MKKTGFGCFAAFLMGLVSVAGSADEIRDYYAEPGLHPFKETVDQSFNEAVDPFSGTLQLTYTDLLVPGNGGLDIIISRSYVNPQHVVGHRDITGVGWAMHFGRIVVPWLHASKICAQSQWSVITEDNPSLEHPDGARELFVLRTNGEGLITKSNWKLDCVNDTKIVTSPNGTIYRMDARIATTENVRFMPTEIEDVNGNKLIFTYDQFSSGLSYLRRVDATDGRTVLFEYENEHISAVIAGEQRVEYYYQPVQNVADNHQYLTEVRRSDGLSWTYEYHPLLTDGTAGSFALKRVRYPYGATIDYTYQGVYFDNEPGHLQTVSVATKTVGGRDISPGTWTFTFKPGFHQADSGRYLDETVITTPAGEEIYRHYGITYLTGTWSLWWAAGLLYEHLIYENGQVIQRTVNDWGSRLISNERYLHGRREVDLSTNAPVLNSRWISRDGVAVATYYFEHDDYGNPGRVEETTNIVGSSRRVTHFTYQNDTSRWILGLPTSETLEGVGTILRTYDERGQLQSENRFGVESTYTYAPEGDLATKTDAMLRTTTYLDYHRGIARQEVHPENVVIQRVVNDTGTIASETNGRGFTKSFTYDGLNRLTGIIYPRGNPVAITYSGTGKELTRGNYIETAVVDGFGKVISLSRKDSIAGEPITVTYQYDALMRKVFQSYPNAGVGDHISYDVLGRIREVTHSDGSRLSYRYPQLGRIDVTDENGNVTQNVSRVYGHPDSSELIQVLSDNANVLTQIQRNILGQPISVFQGQREDAGYGGFERQYAYNENHYLIRITDPETGNTVYGRDLFGNMVSRQVGGEPATTYLYDGLNRLTHVTYPSGTPSVNTAYDRNGSVISISNGSALKSYVYDESDNLTQETAVIGSTSYVVGYTIDANDFTSSVTYPSGRTVQLMPDALGRPTRSAPYVAGITYHPTGHVNSMVFANGQTTSYVLDSRRRIDRIQAKGGSPTVDLNYEYDPASNVVAIASAISPSHSLTLGYDAMNRLTSAAGVWGTSDFAYDGLGNVLRKSTNGIAENYGYESSLRLTHVSKPDVIRSYGYDGYGNITSRSLFSPAWSTIYEEDFYTYNHAAQLVAAEKRQFGQPTVSKTFGYDGQNLRVSAVSNGTETHYVYGHSGQLLGEYTGNVAYGKEHIYVGSQLVATVKQNEPPTANAGQDGQVAAGQVIALDGSASTDRDGSITAYAWKQLSGPVGELLNPNTVSPTYVAPVGAEGVANFQLTVTDDSGETGTDTVNITVVNPPLANAGPDQTVLSGHLVFLGGTGSGGTGNLTYQWSPIGNPVTLDNVETPTASFTAPSVSTHISYSFSLRVTDEAGLSSTDSATVQVLSLTFDSDNDGLPDAWEYTHFGDWTLYGADDDPDGDGLTNAAEYAMGGDPTQPEPAPSRVETITGRAGITANLLEWEPVASANRYSVYWSTTPEFELASAQVIADASSPFIHEHLTNGTTYYYAVVASNNSGDAPKSAEFALTPAEGVWGSAESRSGVAIATNGRGDKAIVRIVGTAEGNYELNVQRYDAKTGWKPVTVLATTYWNEYLPKVKMTESGDILVTWTQRDEYIDWAIMGAAFSVASGTWTATQTITRRSVNNGVIWSVGDLALNAQGGALVWSQDDHIYGALFDTSTLRWSGPYQIDASSSDGCGSSDWSAVVARNAQGDAVFGWTRCGVNTVRSYLAGRGFQPQVALQTASTDVGRNALAVDLADNGQSVVASIENTGGKAAIQTYRFDLASNSVSGPQLLRQLKTRVSNLFAHLSEGGEAYYAWQEEGKLYAQAGGATPVLVGSAAKKSILMHVQSLLGRDRGHVMAWQTGTDAYVARYDAQAQNWTTQLINEGTSAYRQHTAISGIGHIETLWDMRLRSYAPEELTPPNTDAPVTTLEAVRTTQKGAAYYQITLTTNVPATIRFRAGGQGSITAGGDNVSSWQNYTGPITIALDKKGSMTFEYYSEDAAGNTEAVHMEVLQ